MARNCLSKWFGRRRGRRCGCFRGGCCCCRLIRPTGSTNRRFDAWSIRDRCKLILLAITLTLCAFSMSGSSMNTIIDFSSTASPSDRQPPLDDPHPRFGHSMGLLVHPRRRVIPQNPLMYRQHSSFRRPTITGQQHPATINSEFEPLINPHDFNYTISETEVCSGGARTPFLLTVVHTHPANYKRRAVIRETWGGGSGSVEGFQLIVLFMMGSTSENRSLMAAVLAESHRYRDIVQEDFEDSYRNLTHKAVMWLRWASTYCPRARYLLKVDDDIFVNTFNLITHLRHLESRRVVGRRSILCLVWYRMQVVRNPVSKWYVTKDEYPDDHFSNYCSGSAYILTGDLLGDLYERALRTRFFWIDDFYVTGLLPKGLSDISYHNIASLYALKQNEVRDKLVFNNALFGHIPGSLSLRYKLWREILKWRGLDVGEGAKPMSVASAAAAVAVNDTT